MYQPTNSAIGIVQAMVNVPHELPGTSRLASSGSTKPAPVGSVLNAAPCGYGQIERFVEDHGLAGAVAEAVGRARWNRVDARAGRRNTGG